MDIKLLIGTGVAAVGLICTGVAALIGKNKQKSSDNSEDVEVMNHETESVVSDNTMDDEAETAVDSKDSRITESTTVSGEKINEEIETAWREKELAEAEEQYYEKKQVEEEINEAWLEKEMLDDLGWSLNQDELEEEQSEIDEIGGEYQLENDVYLSEEYENLYDEMEYDEDDDSYDEADDNVDDFVIDNTNLEYTNRQICITLNPNERAADYLQKSEEVLCRKFPAIQALPEDDKLQTIVDNVFRDGFIKRTFVRNLSFTNQDGRDRTVVAIRPEILPGDYLTSLLGQGNSLLFRGHISGREFIIDSIYDTSDTEQLPYETMCEFIPMDNPNNVRGGNFFIEVLNETESLTRYTEERLTDWEEYLDWKETLSRRQIIGVKYFRCDIDAAKKRLYFWLVCPDENHFIRIRKYLGRDMYVFENSYSSDNWVFKLVETDNKTARYKSVELGRFRGVIEQYALNKEDYSLEETEYDSEDEEYSESGSDEALHIITEQELLEHFEHPYIAKVAYDLNRTDKDEIDMQDFDNPDEAELYLRENVLTQYFSDGFIALSAVGEFVLIRRFRSTIRNLTNNYASYSPNLAVWLFNISQARLPDKEQKVTIDSWLNPDIAGNDNQRIAVEKMLAAPDVCLIQGPPGTGKTTVIAEGIYQFVKKGYRVLVASQSNDAVDNALERLADSPVIRAVRLGQKSRKKRGLEMGAKQYSADSVLGHYYSALSRHISKQWLDKWNQADAALVECTRDMREVTLYVDEMTRLNQQYADFDSEIQNLRKQEQILSEKVDAANTANAKIRSEKHQLSVLLDVIREKTNTPFYLSDRQLRIVEKIINPVVRTARNTGVLLTLYELNEQQGANNECEYLRIFLDRLDILQGLIERTDNNSDSNVQAQNTMEILQLQADKIKGMMADAFSEGDMDRANELREQLNEVKDKIDALRGIGHVFVVSATEKEMLTDVLYNEIVSGLGDAARMKLQQIFEKAKNAIDALCQQLSDFTDALQLIDTADLLEQHKAVRGKLTTKRAEAAELSDLISAKQNTLPRLAEKYDVRNTTHEAVVDAITQRCQQYEAWLDGQKIVRHGWQSVMQGFCKRLDNSDMLEYDQHFFQQTYIESCNVVGISCTDNMRVLSNYGFDYFDVVIIDEVSKATPPELLIPLMRARKAIIVGDHRQLPPMFNEHEGSYDEMIADEETIPEELRDLMTKENFRRFKKMVTSSLFKEHFERADDSIKHSLLTQYRMHSDIMDVINRFYELRLQKGLSDDTERIRKAHGMSIDGIDRSRFIVPERHAYWIDSSSLPGGKALYDSRGNKRTANSGGTSVYNVLEKWIVIQLLKMLADGWRESYQKTRQKKTVGIISFYQAQVNRIKETFRKERKLFDFSPLEIDINTVDRFQGKEKNIIITSLVRNNPQGRASEHVVAFERINVAFSRAQELLLIVGAKHMYEKQKVALPNMDKEGITTSYVYRNIMEELHRKGTFKGSEKVISSDVEKLIIREYEGGDED